MDKDWDIIVVGGGIAGLATTALLSKFKFRVLCIEPQKPPIEENALSADLRSTAYLVDSIELFKKSGAWDLLKCHAEELRVMRICDTGSSKKQRYQEINFRSKEINLPNFGYNIPNWFVKKSLYSVINSSETGHLSFKQKVVGLNSRLDECIIRLSDDRSLSTKLIIASDGRESDIRFLSKIKTKKWDNNQDAIAFTVTHEKPHNGTSIEVLDSGGPCTFVPLKNSSNGKYQSAVVWMEKRIEAKRLMLLNDNDFSTSVSSRTRYLLGKCTLKSKRTLYPIVTQLADQFYGERLALIAEAAHVMPPIGAQGLNTSFEDISFLSNLINEARSSGSDIGDPSLLATYGKHRRRQAQSKILGVSLLNKTSESNLEVVKDLRKFTLRLIDKNALIRTALMKAGLGKIKIKLSDQ